MFRIARTYKLSLISAESKLSALLIHSDTITMNNNGNNNNNMFQFTSSPNIFVRSDSPKNNNMHQQSQNQKEPISPLRNGSIWRKIGDYIIHVDGNGDIESHNINEQ